MNIKVAGRLFTVHEHQLLLMNCRNPHDFWTTMPCKDYFVHFDGPTANAYYRYLARNDEVAIIRERTDRVVNSMRGIIDVMSGRTKLAPSSVAHLIDGILTDCDANNGIDRTGNATHIAIERVVSYIAEHLDEDLSIDRLAAIACLSRFYFAKAFREIIYVFLSIFLYLLKCPQSLILSALRAFCFCGKPHISRSIFLYFPYQSWLKSW